MNATHDAIVPTPPTGDRDDMTVTLPSDREIVLKRTFNAPRRLVFEAFSKPEHIARWWGWRDHVMALCEMNFRPGGAYRFVLRAPDGSEYGFRGEYREIVPPSRLVQTFEFEGMPGHIATETITLEERDGRTTLTNTVLHATREARDGHVQSGMEAGSRESMNRLAELVATLE